MAEYEHQFTEIDEAQKIFVVREMMRKDIKRDFFTGPRKFDEIMEKLDIIINGMMADDGPTPMDLGNVSGYDTKTTHSTRTRTRTCHTKDVCAIAWKGTRPAREASRDRMGQDHGVEEKELMNGRVARKMTEVRKEARRAPWAASLIRAVTRTREAMGAKGSNIMVGERG